MPPSLDQAKDIRGPKGNHVTKRVENKCATGIREKKGVKIFARNGISGEGVKEGRRRKGRSRRRKGGVMRCLTTRSESDSC